MVNVAHLIMYLEHSRLPNKNECIDHINCIKTDNRIENLRFVTKGGNSHNVGLIKSNTSGIKGVCTQTIKGTTYWIAQVSITDSIGKKVTSKKQFPLTDDGKLSAEKWVKNRRIELHGNCANHG